MLEIQRYFRPGNMLYIILNCFENVLQNYKFAKNTERWEV